MCTLVKREKKSFVGCRRKLSAERDGSRRYSPVQRVAGRRAGHRKGPTTEHGTPVSRYEQLMAAGGAQMLRQTDAGVHSLPTSDWNMRPAERLNEALLTPLISGVVIQVA